MGTNKGRKRSRKANPLTRLTKTAKIGIAYLLCVSMIITCLPSLMSLAGAESDDGTEAETEIEIYSMTLGSLCEAVEDTIRNDDPITGDEYIFAGSDAGLFDVQDGLLFEVYPEVEEDDSLTLRTFIKLYSSDLEAYLKISEKDEETDTDAGEETAEDSEEDPRSRYEDLDLSRYNVTGNEEVIFLLINNTEDDVAARVRVLASDPDAEEDEAGEETESEEDTEPDEEAYEDEDADDEEEEEVIYETPLIVVSGNPVDDDTESVSMIIDPESGDGQLEYIVVDEKEENLDAAALSVETGSNIKKENSSRSSVVTRAIIESIESGSDAAPNVTAKTVPESASNANTDTKKIEGNWHTSLTVDGSRAAAFVTTLSKLGYVGDTTPVTYTAYADGVAVTVELPAGALPEDAELVVTVYDEESDEHIQALSLMQEYITPVETEKDEITILSFNDEEESNSFSLNIYEGDNGLEPESGMATMDISFYVDGEEVEPTEVAEVTIDVSGLLDEYANGVDGFEIWHFEEGHSKPVLVAEVTDADEAADGIAEFIVDGFSQFTVHWFPHYSTDRSHYGQIYVNLYDTDENEISTDITNMNYDIDEHENGMEFAADSDFINAINLTGYTFSYATVTDPSTDETYGTEDNPVAYAILTYEEANTYTWTYTFYNEENDTLYTYTETGRQTNAEPRLNLYFEADEVVEGMYDGVIFTPSNKNATGQAANGGGRLAVSGLRQYADEEGNITIILPTNANMNNTYIYYRGTNASGESVELTSGKFNSITGNYDWKLQGWYNIADGKYYSVEDGKETTATVNLYDNNVFYADYIASSYDFGDADDEKLIDTVSTADFVEIQMFDYNELFNLYSTSLEVTSGDYEAAFTNSTFDEKWSDSQGSSGVGEELGGFYDTPYYIGRDTDDKLSNSFILLGGANGGGTLLNPSSYATHNQSTTNIHSASNWNITSPELDKETNPILWSLFSPDSDRLGVEYIGPADYLFQYGEEGTTGADGQDYGGYYYYSSKLNSVAYNQTAERFYVYDREEYFNQSGTYLTMFLPYNYFTDELGHSDDQTNYWFGMSMKIDFYLPDDTGTEGEPSDNVLNEKEMEFNFSGDDDIMIFIDDKLVLDMAGVHTEADGNINFAEGTWKYYVYTTGNTGISQENSGTFELEAGDHTMTVYYMERGRSASNLTVSFNIIPEWRYESDYVSTVTVSKEWTDGEDIHGSDTVRMGLFELVDDKDRYEVDEDSNTIVIDDSTYTLSENKKYEIDGGIEYSYIPLYFEEGGDGIAWIDASGNVYLLSDPIYGEGYVDLSAANDWTYTWEMLDEDKTYLVVEMTLVDGYISSSEWAEIEDPDYEYWSIIGEDELEDVVAGKEPDELSGTTLQVVLTDAAQSSESTEDTKGVVITHEGDDITPDTDIIFSMRPERVTVESEISNVSGADILTIYGVIGNSQITDDMIWTLTYTTDTDYDISGTGQIHTFTLSWTSENGGTYYLAENEDQTGLTITSDVNSAAEFYCDSAGEIRIHSDDGHRVVIDSSGNLSLESTSDVLETNNLRIYTLTSGHTDLYEMTVTNQRIIELPETGGPGTRMFEIFGLLISGSALGLLYVTLKRRRKTCGEIE